MPHDPNLRPGATLRGFDSIILIHQHFYDPGLAMQDTRALFVCMSSKYGTLIDEQCHTGAVSSHSMWEDI